MAEEHVDAEMVEHIAKLANLPLEPTELTALAAEIETVLDAFGLQDAGGEPAQGPACRLLDDDPEAWPADGVAALLAGVPRLDGRHIRP